MNLIRFVLAALLVAAPAAAAEAYRTYVDGPWGQIHVRVAGDVDDGRPTVLLLHKMVWSSVQFEKAQPALAARGVRSVAIDLPGYGASTGPDSVPSTEAYADALLPVIDRFGGKVSLLGSDTGATIFAALANRHPDRVTKLILHGPAIFDEVTRQKLLSDPHFDQTLMADGGHLQRRWDMMYKLAGAKSSLESVHRSILEFFTAGPDEWYGHDAIFRHDLGATVMRLKVPTLLLIAKGDVLYTQALETKRMRPDFDLIELPWTGVHVIYDAPESWSDAVAGYLKR